MLDIQFHLKSVLLACRIDTHTERANQIDSGHPITVGKHSIKYVAIVTVD